MRFPTLFDIYAVELLSDRVCKYSALLDKIKQFYNADYSKSPLVYEFVLINIIACLDC